MVLSNLLSLWMALKSIVISCPFPTEKCDSCPNKLYEVNMIGRLPEEVKESSGLAAHNDLFFTHDDSGGKPVLFAFKNDEVDLMGQVNFPEEVKNVDWEDLAQDEDGHIFMGDFGNNNNNRKDLKIYRYHIFSGEVETISFSYEDQLEFPPKKNKNKRFDCEAMLWARGKLYLFAKIRGGKQVKVYQLPDQAGEYVAREVFAFKMREQITAADISPEKGQVALLSYGKVLLYYADFDQEDNLRMVPFYCKRFVNSGQSEAILYLNEEELLITNEKGKVFLMNRRTLFEVPERYTPELPKMEAPELLPAPDEPVRREN
ncbi:hypothetical protein PEDI_01290 [Persicobacter diffluens]|uniref:Uncharacterized protein n=2 Tax=Persicobacter diffluens TaxID=981 RepID=A0AAN5AI90_9BACT|nr:hypothetical protein PEDI_01290 [Persicobacter diffluens]